MLLRVDLCEWECRKRAEAEKGAAVTARAQSGSEWVQHGPFVGRIEEIGMVKPTPGVATWATCFIATGYGISDYSAW